MTERKNDVLKRLLFLALAQLSGISCETSHYKGILQINIKARCSQRAFLVCNH
jgi:hypothetical protein